MLQPQAVPKVCYKVKSHNNESPKSALARCIANYGTEQQYPGYCIGERNTDFTGSYWTLSLNLVHPIRFHIMDVIKNIYDGRK